MESVKVAKLTRRQLESLPPEKRAAAEAVIARTQTPEYQEREIRQREAIRREIRETGRVAVTPAATGANIETFLMTLRGEREARGLSLADVADASGIDKAALSRLESGQHVNPTLSTLTRYARAIGKRVHLSLED
jgi:hypothetical protein